jgi:hypothetical protein
LFFDGGIKHGCTWAGTFNFSSVGNRPFFWVWVAPGAPDTLLKGGGLRPPHLLQVSPGRPDPPNGRLPTLKQIYKFESHPKCSHFKRSWDMRRDSWIVDPWVRLVERLVSTAYCARSGSHLRCEWPGRYDLIHLRLVTHLNLLFSFHIFSCCCHV